MASVRVLYGAVRFSYGGYLTKLQMYVQLLLECVRLCLLFQPWPSNGRKKRAGAIAAAYVIDAKLTNNGLRNCQGFPK
jgi:hypothetical protein